MDLPAQEDAPEGAAASSERRRFGCFMMLLGCLALFVAVDLAAITVLGSNASAQFTVVGQPPVAAAEPTSKGPATAILIIIGAGGLALAIWGERLRGRR